MWSLNQWSQMIHFQRNYEHTQREREICKKKKSHFFTSTAHKLINLSLNCLEKKLSYFSFQWREWRPLECQCRYKEPSRQSFSFTSLSSCRALQFYENQGSPANPSSLKGNHICAYQRFSCSAQLRSWVKPTLMEVWTTAWAAWRALGCRAVGKMSRCMVHNSLL